MAGRADIGLYEREAQLRLAADTLSSAANHRGRALFIVSGPGLGKTSLLEHICQIAQEDFIIGSATGDLMEASVAFSFIGQALDALGCPDPHIDARAPGASVSDVRSTQFHRVSRWLRTPSKPAVITLDDLHWADSESAALLSYLCRRLERLPVAIVATLRPWPPAAHDLARRLAATRHATLTELAPLSGAAAARLVTDRIHAPAGEQVIERAVSLCGGNPLLLEQVSALVDRGDDLSSPQLSRELPNPQPVLLSRFAALPAEVIRCAQAASVFGTRFRPSLAASVAQVPEKDIERTLETLSRSGLVREVADHMVEFVHPLFSQLLYEDLGSSLREQLHRRACLVLLERGLDREAAQHAMRGHLVGDPTAIAVLERVGLDALRQGAAAPAAQYLRTAVELAGQRATRTALTGLSEALLAAGQYREAIECGERLVAMPAESPGEQAEALAILAKGLAQSGRLAEACDYLEKTVAAAKDTDLALAVEAQTEYGYYRWWMSGPTAALPYLAKARDMARAGAAGSRVAAVWGFVALQAGDPSGFGDTAVAGRAVLAAPRSHLADFTTTWGALASFAVSARVLEHFGDAERAYTAGLEAAEQAGAGLTAGALGLSVSYAELLMRLGKLAEALDVTARVLGLSDVMPALTATASVIHAEILLHLGRMDDAVQWLERAKAAPGFRLSWIPALRLSCIRGEIALRAGDWTTAGAHYLEAEELTAQAGIEEPCFSPWARHAIVAHLRAGRTGDAERVLGWLDRCSVSLPCRWPRIAALTGLAGLAELAGDAEAAEAAFKEALSMHAGLGLPLERIETLLEYGMFLRRTGAQARARPQLAEAIAIAETHGASWLAALAHRELAASGGRRRRRGAADNRLTPQQRRVFDLAVQGLSNDAIASRLRVSAGTVKTHLEHIYAKLGVHSRRELMLRRIDPPPGPGVA